MNSWDEKFMELAHFISKWSKDNSRGVGAVIVDNRNRIVSVGYNGFPTGVNDDIKERYERPQKYKYTEHAERNAIYNSNTSLIGCRIYITLFPCSDCARGIIQTGMTEVICPDFSEEEFNKHDFIISKEMLLESGVVVRQPKI